MKKHIFALSVVAFISACSSKPGNSDLEKIIGNHYSGCENASISSVKKINGYETDNGLYHVEYVYKINLEKNIVNEINNLVQEKISRQEEAKSRLEDFYKKQEELNSKIEQWLFENHGLQKGDYSGFQWSSKISEYSDQNPFSQELRQHMRSNTYEKINQDSYRPEYDKKIINLKSELELGCKNTSGVFSIRKLADYHESHIHEMKGSYLMRKTENGWHLV